jgi:hypothetical protein
MASQQSGLTDAGVLDDARRISETMTAKHPAAALTGAGLQFGQFRPARRTLLDTFHGGVRAAGVRRKVREGGTTGTTPWSGNADSPTVEASVSTAGRRRRTSSGYHARSRVARGASSPRKASFRLISAPCAVSTWSSTPASVRRSAWPRLSPEWRPLRRRLPRLSSQHLPRQQERRRRGTRFAPTRDSHHAALQTLHQLWELLGGLRSPQALLPHFSIVDGRRRGRRPPQ